mmetsp:Transcript_39305/g.72402  ORF Transcript_39305/g.72402 Transcript_39305/m.72402 type:complete len:82 (-) Transcript_39305:958-1203(-)
MFCPMTTQPRHAPLQRFGFIAKDRDTITVRNQKGLQRTANCRNGFGGQLDRMQEVWRILGDIINEQVATRSADEGSLLFII